MRQALLSETEFSRAVVSRVRRERPDLEVRATPDFELVVRDRGGQRWVVSLELAYRMYRDRPSDREAVIGAFLASRVYADTLRVGSFRQNAHRIMPQIVPQHLLEFCRRTGQELAAVESVGDLAIAFVLDYPHRYSYVTRSVGERWGKDETQFLAAAVANLQRLHDRTSAAFQRFKTGDRISVVCETFDGYDASRLLLVRELTAAAAHVAGRPLLAVPHRDYLVIFGDDDAAFVAEMRAKIREMHLRHPYPISTNLYTWEGGVLEVYDEERRPPRLVN